jgi:hypothetical protein
MPIPDIKSPPVFAAFLSESRTNTSFSNTDTLQKPPTPRIPQKTPPITANDRQNASKPRKNPRYNAENRIFATHSRTTPARHEKILPLLPILTRKPAHIRRFSTKLRKTL